MNPADKSMSKYFIKIHFSIHLEESTGYQKEQDTPNGKQIILIIAKFLAPTGAQEMQISVRSFVCLFGEKCSRAHNLHLLGSD